jgi:uncharacterized lipoprotein YmbA
MVSATALLTGCGFLPNPRTFVIGDAPPAVGVRPETGLPIIELKTVSVPDYLDSTDILRRSGPNEVTPSPTGRWGERLSLGLTDALTSALSKRLPKLVITNTPTSEPLRRILVDIEQVDIGTDCLMTARWRITHGDRQNASEGGRGTFSEIALTTDDAAIASAMTRLTDQLAEQIASAMTLK